MVEAPRFRYDLRMLRRIVVPRLPESSSASHVGESALVDPPGVEALRIVFGVGPGGDRAPTSDSFKPTYSVSLPVFSVGGLDPDGVYEFDAAQLMRTIVGRSLRRRWGIRVELELTQKAATVGRADLHVETPFEDDSELELHVQGKTGTGTMLPGGVRSIVLATSVVTDPKLVSKLGGAYSVQLRDTDPQSSDKPSVKSLTRTVNVDLTRFEFEG